MNTKTEQVSSGLVAVAYIDTSNDMGDRLKWKDEYDDDQPLVRLSDAEAIIADLQNLVVAENQRKQQLEAEVERLKSDLDEEAHIRDRMAQLLAETAVALKGPEKALHRHGWQDLPEVAAKQSAAHKLAREALDTISSLEASNGCILSLRECMDIAEEALAAIDALGE